MSWHATAWAVEQRAGSAAAKLVLLVLAERADRYGVCYPSVSLLAIDTEMSERSVYNHLSGLRAKGLITWTHRVRPDGSQSSSEYRLLLTPLQLLQGPPEESAGGTLHQLQGDPAPVADLEEQVIEPVKDTRVRKRTAQTDAHTSDFEQWYRSYPKRVDRGDAVTAYAKARKKASAEVLLAGARAYAKSRQGKDPTYTKKPRRWLDAESWLDELPTEEQPHIEGLAVWELEPTQ